MLRREREVNPRTCVPPKANEAVQHLMDPNRSDIDKLRLEHIKISPCCIACLTRGTNFTFKQDPFAGSQTLKTIRESVQHGCLIRSIDRIESVGRTSLSKMVLGDWLSLKD
jgi:hypothetical protein